MNISAIRNETSGCHARVHLNNAGSSLPPHRIVQRIFSHLSLEEELGGYEAAQHVAVEVDDFYKEAARLINASPREIAYSESATNAWQRIFYSVPLAKGDRVIVFQNEYASNYLAVLHRQKQTGFTIDVIRNNEQGDINLDDLREKMDGDVRLVLLCHMPSQSGQLAPAAAVGEIVKQHNAIFLLDATQTVGQYPIDVQSFKCDALCATGRKFLRGPRGTGFLYVKDSLASMLEPAMIDLEGAHWTGINHYDLAPGAKRFATWECSIALKLGLKEALRYANDLGIDNIWQRAQALAQRLRRGLQDLNGLTLHDPGTTGAIVTFTIDGHDPESIVDFLARKNIAINISRRKYAFIDFSERNLEKVCRASPHYYNTENEIDQAIDALRAMSEAS